MAHLEQVRIDKFLWAVRIFKTRSIAAEAIKKGRITIGGSQVKGSRNVKVGEVIQVKVSPAIRSFEIIQLAQNRMGAKLVPDHIKEVTPKDQLEIIELQKLALSLNRRKGLGRPTKKERRDLDSFFGNEQIPDDFEFAGSFDFDGDDDDFDDLEEE
ncbi:MAG: RNA-binding S4 domain-containing protein [Bacteroidales bacterium]|nr:RNA-binding S4 domain-containing protein [Bacteroidales bacterium]